MIASFFGLLHPTANTFTKTYQIWKLVFPQARFLFLGGRGLRLRQQGRLHDLHLGKLSGTFTDVKTNLWVFIFFPSEAIFRVHFALRFVSSQYFLFLNDMDYKNYYAHLHCYFSLSSKHFPLHPAFIRPPTIFFPWREKPRFSHIYAQESAHKFLSACSHTFKGWYLRRSQRRRRQIQIS